MAPEFYERKQRQGYEDAVPIVTMVSIKFFVDAADHFSNHQRDEE